MRTENLTSLLSPQGGICVIRRRTGDVRRLMVILAEVLTDRAQTSRASVNQPFLRLMTSAVPVSDSRALTPYSATPASKVLGAEVGFTSGVV